MRHLFVYWGGGIRVTCVCVMESYVGWSDADVPCNGVCEDAMGEEGHCNCSV